MKSIELIIFINSLPEWRLHFPDVISMALIELALWLDPVPVIFHMFAELTLRVGDRGREIHAQAVDILYHIEVDKVPYKHVVRCAYLPVVLKEIFQLFTFI